MANISEVELRLMNERILEKRSNKEPFRLRDTVKKGDYIPAAKPNKFRNKKCVVDGIKFDSMKEAKRYGELKLLEKDGHITNLKFQKKFPFVVNGFKICEYWADFWYEKKLPKGEVEFVVEDVKSTITRKSRAYSIKRKLLFALYGLMITEI